MTRADGVPAPEILRGVRGLLFDYGNTLIRYGRREDEIVVGELHSHVETSGHPVDLETFREAVRAVTGPLIERATTTGREVRRDEKAIGVFERLGIPVTEEIVAGSVRAMTRGFVSAIEAADDLAPRLERLGKRFRIGLLSNFFLAGAIHESLRKIGIEHLLDPRIVSAEIGWCKPHPKAFEPALAGLDLPPSEVLMVGDNLTADVAGGAAVGMRTVYTREHLQGALPYGRPEGNGVRPDLTVQSLAELESLLSDA